MDNHSLCSPNQTISNVVKVCYVIDPAGAKMVIAGLLKYSV